MMIGLTIGRGSTRGALLGSLVCALVLALALPVLAAGQTAVEPPATQVEIVETTLGESTLAEPERNLSPEPEPAPQPEPTTTPASAPEPVLDTSPPVPSLPASTPVVEATPSDPPASEQPAPELPATVPATPVLPDLPPVDLGGTTPTHNPLPALGPAELPSPVVATEEPPAEKDTRAAKEAEVVTSVSSPLAPPQIPAVSAPPPSNVGEGVGGQPVEGPGARETPIASVLDAQLPAGRIDVDDNPFTFGLSVLESVSVVPPPAPAPSQRQSSGGPLDREPVTQALVVNPSNPIVNPLGGPSPRGKLLEVLASYVFPGAGPPKTIALLVLMQIGAIVLAFSYARPRALFVSLAPLVQRRSAGYRAVSLRPG